MANTNIPATTTTTTHVTSTVASSAKKMKTLLFGEDEEDEPEPAPSAPGFSVLAPTTSGDEIKKKSSLWDSLPDEQNDGNGEWWKSENKRNTLVFD